MATSNVIFAIGSKMGPGGLASLQAGVQMTLQLGKAVFAAIDKTEKFAQAYSRLQVDIDAADQASKGLIDTFALIQGANEITASGLQITSEELANITKVTADYAQKTGRDATAEFKKFSRALATGRTTTLKEYGIEIKGVTDKTKVFEKVMADLEEQAKDANPQLQTTNEKLFAMQNAFDTASGRGQVMYNTISTGTGVLDLGVDAFTNLDGVMKESMDTMESMGQEFSEISSIIVGMFYEIGISFNEALSDLPFIGDAFARAAEATEAKQREALTQMRINEEVFREKMGRGSTQFTDEDGAPKPGGQGARPPSGKGKGATAEKGITDDDLFAGFGERGALDVSEAEFMAELEEERLDREREKLSLRQEEISMQMQMRDIQKEMAEFSAAGIETGHLQSDFGTVATEEGNELKQEKLDLIASEMDLLRSMNEEKLTGMEAEKESTQELIDLEAMRTSAITNTFRVGSNFGAQLARQRRKEREAERRGQEVEKVGFKALLADVAANESLAQGVKGIAEFAEGLAAVARYDGVSATAHFSASAQHGVAAAAWGTLSAALGGSGQSGGSANSTGAPGGSAGVAPPSAGGGGSGDPRNQEINVILQGDAETLFDVIQEEDASRRRHNLDPLET